MRLRDRGEPPIEGGGLHRMGVVGQEQPDRMRIGGKGEEPARVAYSDEAGRGFRFEAGRRSEAKPATIPI